MASETSPAGAAQVRIDDVSKFYGFDELSAETVIGGESARIHADADTKFSIRSDRRGVTAVNDVSVDRRGGDG